MGRSAARGASIHLGQKILPATKLEFRTTVRLVDEKFGRQ